MTKNNNQDLLNRMCREARKAFAARNGLRVRKGQVGGM